MIWLTPYTVPFVGASLISVVLGLYIWLRHPDPEARTGALLLVAGTLWIMGYAFELASADLPTKLFWFRANYLGTIVIPVIWFVFALQYTGREKWLTRSNLLLLGIIPAITVLLLLTNEAHGLVWTSLTLDTEGPFLTLQQTYGAWFWVNTAYSYVLAFITVFYLIQIFAHVHRLYRLQTGALLFITFVIIVGDILEMGGLSPLRYLGLTPLAFVVIDLVLIAGLFLLRLRTIVPVTRSIVVESMADGLIVLDAHNTIIDANPAAEHLIGNSVSSLLGKSMEEVWPGWSEQIDNATITTTGREVVLSLCEKHICDVEISALHDWRNRIVSRAIVFRDITERKKIEEQVKTSLREKEVLLREIHHRVKNNLQIISSLLSLQSAHIKDKKYTEMLKESQNRVKSMALIHEKLYQSEDIANVNCESYIKSLVEGLVRSYGTNTGNIALEIEVSDISLGIDAAIPCGLIVNELVSNALKHAFPDGRKGVIKIRLHSIGDKVQLLVSDDGVGMPETVDFRTTESLGLRLVTILAEDQLNGEIHLDRQNGTAFSVIFGKMK